MTFVSYRIFIRRELTHNVHKSSITPPLCDSKRFPYVVATFIRTKSREMFFVGFVSNKTSNGEPVACRAFICRPI